MSIVLPTKLRRQWAGLSVSPFIGLMRAIGKTYRRIAEHFEPYDAFRNESLFDFKGRGIGQRKRDHQSEICPGTTRPLKSGQERKVVINAFAIPAFADERGCSRKSTIRGSA